MFKTSKIRTLFLSFTLFIGSMGLFAQVQQDISDVQLAQFADAYINMQKENQAAQSQVMTMIEEEGLEVERFSEIQQAASDPSLESNATPEEVKKHATVMAKIEAMQDHFEERAIAGIEASGITMEEYQAIATALQQDQTLVTKLQAILMEKTQE